MDTMLEASRQRAWRQLGEAVDELELAVASFERSRYPGGGRIDPASISLRRDNLAAALKQIPDIRRRIHAHHIEALRDDLADVLFLARKASLNLPFFKEEFAQAFSILEVPEAELLYEQQVIIEPQIVVAVSDALIVALAKNPRMLYELAPREFEKIVAELFRKEGFDVELTQETCDGGVDIIAISRRMNITQKTIVECKRYAPQNRVGIEIVQRVLGVKHQLNANKAVVVTTSSFSRPAERVAREKFWELDLKGYNDVVGWLQSAAH